MGSNERQRGDLRTATKRFLFVAYCISNPNGDSLIGVYKRVLRIGLGLARRGHDVIVFCPGRDQYKDALTAEAEARLSFFDLPLEVLFEPDVEIKRARFRQALKDLAPDVIVIGEAPLAGALLEYTTAAVTMFIPVVVVDNAYGSIMASAFAEDHGPMVDGVLLTGPSSFHMDFPPSHVRQIPPFIRLASDRLASDRLASDDRAGLLRQLGISGDNLVTVLAYEVKAERLAQSLLNALPDPVPDFVFVTRDQDGCRSRLASLPERLRSHTHVIAPPSEEAFFGLLEVSRLAIGKCGFMQVTECLALHTPFIGVTYRGCFDHELFPSSASRFLHATRSIEADEVTVQTARRFLALDPDELAAVHDGSLHAVEGAVDFLEQLSPTPRRVAASDLATFGYTDELLSSALSDLHPHDPVTITSWRVSRIRRLRDSCVDSIVCHYTTDNDVHCAPLWGRRYRHREQFEEALEQARAADSGRRVLCWSAEDALLIETDAGERLLPALEV